jgi:hypothetical protein
MLRPPKRPNLLADVRAAARNAGLLLSAHARQRMAERGVVLPDILQVLGFGQHEKAKDEFEKRFQSWNYAIRGKTVDGRELRIVVGFDPALLVITVIDLDA